MYPVGKTATFLACFLITLIICGVIMHHPPATNNPGPSELTESPRRNSIPVHYVSGTHYEVGYSVGRTFGAMINEFVQKYEPLQSEFLPLYSQPEGRRIYDESLKATEKYFPQYVIELKGVADGAGLPFHVLFLMALDDTLPKNVNTPSKDKGPVGCTSLMINQPNAQLLGHTEDALSETVNHYYIVAAHVIPGEAENNGTFAAREEKFEALAYAGHLPGYASGHNDHGLVFSINTIFVSKPLSGRIPREFITRALLSSKSDLAEILEILTNEGVGTADAFNVNLGFLDVTKESRVFHTIEVVPYPDGSRSEIHMTDFTMGSNSLHTNKLLHLKYPELNEEAYGSSLSREKRYYQLTAKKDATSVKDMLKILGNNVDDPWPIFSDKSSDRVNTINLGIFDFNNKTWTMWTCNPNVNPPLLRLPLTFADLISPVGANEVINKVETTEEFYPSL